MTSISDLETPAVLIDLDVVEANIERTQSLFDQLGIGFRPHIKTHKIPFLAELQMKQGAVGIAAQKISEAEVFAAAGFTDILLCFNLLSAAKIARLRTLMDSCHMTVVADNLDVVRALSLGMSGSQTLLDVLVECDTGMGRCGVQSPQAACDLALAIAAAPGLHFAGLMTYPAPGTTLKVQAFLSQALDKPVLGEDCPDLDARGFGEKREQGIDLEYEVELWRANEPDQPKKPVSRSGQPAGVGPAELLADLPADPPVDPIEKEKLK